MPRGYVWSLYHTDDGDVFALRVDADYALQPQRGFLEPAPPGTSPLPRGWLPRHVVGLDAGGRRQTAVVSSPEADLWTGTRLDFDIIDTDAQLQTCTVIGRVAERTSRRP